MAQQRKPFTADSLRVPPSLDDVLAYRRWYDEIAAGSAMPEGYQRFLQKVNASRLVQLLCSETSYDLAWRHALRTQIGVMWETFRYPQLTKRTQGKGRPQHFHSENFTFHMCVLDRIVHGLLGDTDAYGRFSKHFNTTAKLLRDFFPEQCRESWTDDKASEKKRPRRRRARERITLHLRKHPSAERAVRSLAEARVAALSQDEQFRQGRLAPAPGHDSGPPPSSISIRLG